MKFLTDFFLIFSGTFSKFSTEKLEISKNDWILGNLDIQIAWCGQINFNFLQNE